MATTKMASTTILLVLALLLSLPTPSWSWEKRVDAHGKTIIAYYASWQWYDRNGLAKPSNLDHSKVTRYNFAFFQVDTSGEIWGTDSWADPIVLYGEFDWNAVPGASNSRCSWNGPAEPPACAGHNTATGLISQAHAAGVEVYPSIGGWTLSDPFSKLAENPDSRKRFAENCVSLIEEYDMDGIDIDWEYPGYVDHSGRPMDTVNYTLFLQTIRDALDVLGERTGRFYGLTAALPCGPDLIKNINIGEIKDVLTEFNLMTYDFHGSWNKETGANAPLYDMDGSPEFSVHGCVENWKAGGARPDQINIGLPFYGRSFAGNSLTGFGQTHGGYADTVTWSDDEGSPQYFNIVDKMSQFTSFRDPQTKTQYMYNKVGFVSYDDERAICDKTKYAIDNGVKGFIVWEISGDLLRDMSTPLLDAVNNKLNNPTVACGPEEEPLAAEGGSAVIGDQWYPSQSLGYCVNDGKQLENFMAPDLIFASPEACCKAIFSHNSKCVVTSLDPTSNGEWVPLDEDSTGGEHPWYPSQKLGFCVNDGKQQLNFIGPDHLFSSAEACCKEIYGYSLDCAQSSSNPGSDGQWVPAEGAEAENPWYPNHNLGYCMNDGKQKDFSIPDGTLFSSAEACCDSIYSYSSTCVQSSTNPGSDGQWIPAKDTVPWYPSHNLGYCINDGNQKDLFTPDESLFSSAEACCDAVDYFGDNCLLASIGSSGVGSKTPPPTPIPLKSPPPTQVKTLRPTKKPKKKPKPEPIAETSQTAPPDDVEVTVVIVRETSKPTSRPTEKLKPKHDVTTQPTPRLIVAGNDYIVRDDLFYPHYGDDGTLVECRIDGESPGWVSKNMMKISRVDCCTSFFQTSQLDQCIAGHPFYPNFEGRTCLNDGMHPNWMAGDYLTDNLWLCCHNFFERDDKMLQQCTGALPGCMDCNLSQHVLENLDASKDS